MFRHHLVTVALLAAFVTPLNAGAQTAPGPAPAAPGVVAPGANAQHRRHHRNGYMHAMRQLNLTDAQKQQIAGILKTSRAADQKTRRANAMATRKQIEGVLTDAQRTQLQAQLARGHRPDAKPNGPAPKPQ